MSNKIKFALAAAVMLFLVWSLGLHAGTESGNVAVTQVPASIKGLQAGWNWAVASAQKLNDKKGFYIAYSIHHMMGENSCMGSFHEGKTGKRLTLNEIIYGKKLPDTNHASLKDKNVGTVAREALKNTKSKKEAEKKVVKEVVFLFRFQAGPTDCRKIHVSNLNMTVELADGPIFWLGTASNEESLPFLQNFYHQLSASKNLKPSIVLDLKEDLITTVALHDNGALVHPFLKGVLTGNEPDELRGKAAFWIGESQHPQGVKLLSLTAINDKSHEVREQAVFGLYLMHVSAADDALIDLAKNGKDREVKKKAIFWLGQKAVQRSAEVLVALVDNETDTDVQESAVFSLSQLSANQGVPALIKIAKTHKSLAVRKKAIFWLSQSDDSRALDTIVSMIEK